MEEKTEKTFLVFNLITFKYGIANSHNPEQDTCHCKSMC